MAKRLCFIVSLAGCLLLSLMSHIPVFAANEPLKWSAVNIPADGKPGWTLAAGSDVRHLTISTDGTLFAYANPSGTGDTLFKSTDGGYSWSATGGATESIVAIATAANNARAVAYATKSKVYRSLDGGKTFNMLIPAPGGSGSGNIEITSLAIAQQGVYCVVAVGTRDTESAEYGGVYVFDEEKFFTWMDTGIGAYDVYALDFSPAYATDAQLAAVITDETDTYISSRIADGGWGSLVANARVLRDGTAAVSLDTSAAVAFPPGYSAVSGERALYLGLDTGAEGGDVYRIELATAPGSSRSFDLDIGAAYGSGNVDVTSLAVSGGGRLMAGAAGSAQVYSSYDGGSIWASSEKPPTGGGTTCVLMTGDGVACAATSGTESAFSRSTDGATWNQTSLIDTTIASVVDLALSPSLDDTLFLLTFGGKHSLWRSRDGAGRWERVFCSALAGVDSIGRAALLPESDRLLLSGTSWGIPGIWSSADSGQSFAFHITPDPNGGTFTIDCWTVADGESVLAGGYDGSSGVVYRINSSGRVPGKGTAGGSLLNSIALSPDFARDRTVLVGNTSGEVFYSTDGGESFETLPPNAASAPLSGNISVAFDADFTRNRAVYAASDDAGKGIYRFTIGRSLAWESFNGTLPAGSKISRLTVSPNGTLYGANAKAGCGVERCLEPSFPLAPTFKTLTAGLESNATIGGLWVLADRLWAIDTTNKKLLSFADALTQTLSLKSPSDRASGIELKGIVLDWQGSGGATKYHWQLDYDGNFSAVPSGFEDDTEATSVRLPLLEPGMTYYWRVRAIEPVPGPWSAKRSFTTTLGSGAGAPRPLAPEAGARSVPLKPVLQWDIVPGASNYELLLGTDLSFANPVVTRLDDYALPANAWECTVRLSYGTAYYWKVRACSAGTQSAWSAVSAFTTEPAPEPTPPPEAKTLSDARNPAPVQSPPPAQPLPSPPPPAPTANPPPEEMPGWAKWVIHLGAGLLAVLVGILATLIVLVARMRKG